MILGFGKTEVEREQQIANEITAKFCEMYDKSKCTYFTDALVKDFRKWLEKYTEKFHQQANIYKKLSTNEVPQRYSYFWTWITNDATSAYIRLKFHHINRQHALSPDGWGMWERKVIIHIENDWDDTLNCGLYQDEIEVQRG